MTIKTNYDITGDVYGHLIVISKEATPQHLKDYKNTYWKCRCVCGTESVFSRDSLSRGRISCGCIKKPRKKYVRTKETISEDLKRLKRLWNGMKIRCFDERCVEFHNYGGKGITICDSWLDFNNFKDDMYELYLEFEKVNGEKSATIDRINPKGNYEPDNCRWATQLEQARNRSNNISVEIDGVLYNTISEASEAYEISYQTILQRHNRGLVGLALVDKSNLLNPNKIRYPNGRIVYKVSE